MDTRQLVGAVRGMTPASLASFVSELSPAEVIALSRDLADGLLIDGAAPRYDDLVLEPHQRPPDSPWTTWLMLGGRGTGKTSAASAEVYRHVMYDPPCIPGVPGGHRVAMIAPTLGDASRSVNAPGGLKSLDPAIREVTRKGGTYVDFPTGATMSEHGAYTKDDVERLRAGGNTCLLWAEELVAWRQLGYENDAWDLAHTGRRLGPRPRTITTTTPKPIPKLRELVDKASDPDNARVVSTHGTTFDNPHLADSFVAEMRELYEGTRLEAQELLGVLLGEVVGALWTEDLLTITRRAPDQVPAMDVTVVAVDPSFSDQQGSDDTGIIVAGRGRPPGGAKVSAYVLDDRSTDRGAFGWPALAVEAYHEYDARAVVAEANLGGRDFIRKSIHAVDPNVHVDTVHASQGKRLRAEPVALFYDQQRAHHVGTFPLLESELTTWVPGEASPNRLDALVWALTYLAPGLSSRRASTASAAGRGRVTRGSRRPT